MASGCKPDGYISYGGSNPSLPTGAGVAQLVEHRVSIPNVEGSIHFTRCMGDAEQKRAYQRAHYHAHKEQWRAKRMRYETNIRLIILASINKPFSDCGVRWHTMVMELDLLHGKNA